MPISPQEARRRAKEQAVTKEAVQTYVIVDEHYRPNAHGLGGVKPFVKNGKHCLVHDRATSQVLARRWRNRARADARVGDDKWPLSPPSSTTFTRRTSSSMK